MEKWNYESRAYVTEQYAYTYDSTFETMDPVLKLRRGTSTITEIYHYDSTEPSNGNMCWIGKMLLGRIVLCTKINFLRKPYVKKII